MGFFLCISNESVQMFCGGPDVLDIKSAEYLHTVFMFYFLMYIPTSWEWALQSFEDYNIFRLGRVMMCIGLTLMLTQLENSTARNVWTLIWAGHLALEEYFPPVEIEKKIKIESN